MLSSRAEHLREKSIKDFPTTWLSVALAVAMVFSFNGGYINAVCFVGVWRTGLTHLTGSSTNFSIRLVNPPKVGQFSSLDLLGFVVLFGIGGFVGGLILGPSHLKWGCLQGVCWVIFGLAMAVGWYLAPRPADLHLGVPGALAVAFAMGLQNAATSLFTPIVVRSSHVSGTVLDTGIGLGQCVRDRNWDNIWKVKFHLPNYIAFLVGALVGTVAYNHLGHNALLANVAFGLVVGLGTLAFGTVFADHKKVDATNEVAMENLEENEDLLQRPTSQNISRRATAKASST